MPELPEVQTTVNGLSKTVVGKTIRDVWSDFYIKTSHGHRQNLKNERYFKNFKKKITGSKIKEVGRIGKNILIHLNNGQTIIIHMKMTGHLLYGKYKRVASSQQSASRKEKWVAKEAGPLQDPFNRFIHFVATLSNGKHLVLSDMRKFASISISETKKLKEHESIKELGPDPLKEIGLKEFISKIKAKKKTPIKKTLLDQSVISGIGNIYSDEILWMSNVHPDSESYKIPEEDIKKIFGNTRKILVRSIKIGGDSMSDYRNIMGEKGGFQNFHKVYRMTNKRCSKAKCGGIIKRKIIGDRNSHFCPKHQVLYK